MLLKFVNNCTVGLTIGFEEETYTVTEPTGIQTIQTVCMVILQGTLGRNLTVRPITNDDTATSKYSAIYSTSILDIILYISMALIRILPSSIASSSARAYSFMGEY